VPEMIPPPDYSDEHVMLSVEVPTASRSTLRLRAAGTGVGAVIDLSATGATRLAELLRSAAVSATARGLTEEDEPVTPDGRARILRTTAIVRAVNAVDVDQLGVLLGDLGRDDAVQTIGLLAHALCSVVGREDVEVFCQQWEAQARVN